MSNQLAKNRKAFHDFEIIESVEAGIVLTGTEVKSCRSSDVSLQEAYANIVNGEVILHSMHISHYKAGNRHNHEPKRERKLLLHKSEIRKLKQQIDQRGLTLIPLSMYLKRGKVKISLGLCRGKNQGDKRDTLKKREDVRDMQRAIRDR